MFTSRLLQVLLLLACGVTALLAGCETAPPPPKPVMIQYDKCGGNVRNPMGLPADVATNVMLTNPTGYAQMIVDWYDKHPQCRGYSYSAPAP